MSDVDENRIRVNLQPELTPTRHEDRVDVTAAVDVGVQTHLKGWGVVGAVCLGLGLVAMLVALVMFSFGGFPMHVNFVKTVVLLASAGVVLLFFGTSAFFFGRTVLGSGRVDQYATREVEVSQPEGGA